MVTDDFRILANRQDGLITRSQALAVGVTPAGLRHALRHHGPWQRVLPGVYATFNGRLQPEQRLVAAVLYGGPGAMVTGVAACVLHGMRYVPDSTDVIRIVIDANGRKVDAGFVQVSASRRLPKPVQRRLHRSRRAGLPSPTVPVVPAYRAVLDVAREIGMATSTSLPRTGNGRPVFTRPGVTATYDRALRDVRALICESVQRGLARQEQLLAELAEGPRKGSGLARRVLVDVAAGCRSAPECEFRDLVRSSDVLPEPRLNQPLPGYPWLCPDACWPEARLVVEIDSAEWHRFGDAPEITEQRRARLASMGWRVIPVSPRRLRAEPAVVLAEIEKAYLMARFA